MSVNVKLLNVPINIGKNRINSKNSENFYQSNIITNVVKSSKHPKPKFQKNFPLNMIDENSMNESNIRTKLTFDEDVIMNPRKILTPEKEVSYIESENLKNYIINVSLSKANNFPVDEYRSLFTKIVREDYSNAIITSLLSEEEENLNFLSNHNITEKMRTRMIDWMIEVLSNYHCEENTFFEAVNIMDRYFRLAKKKLQPEELHLIGVTSMFMASKYHDIYPLRIKTVQEKIAHSKLSSEEIRGKEEEIEKLLNYSIGKPSIWDFINCFIEEIFICDLNKHFVTNETLLNNYYINENQQNFLNKEIFNTLYTKNMINLLKYVCIYLGKMNYHNYNLSQKKPSLLAASVIFVAIKICEQINKEEYINDYLTNSLMELTGQNENDIIILAQKILYDAQNFEVLYSGLENLKKVHFTAIIELKNTK